MCLIYHKNETETEYYNTIKEFITANPKAKDWLVVGKGLIE